MLNRVMRDNRKFFPVDVKAYSGYIAEEYPVVFFYQDTYFTVNEILDRWYEGGAVSSRPVVNYFKILTDEKEFLLRYHPVSGMWEICDLE